MKARRAGHLECYERAFRKFVDAHETYLSFEVNKGMTNVANESYKREKENKFLLDVELSTWKSKMKGATKAMSKSDHKSRRSSKTGRSSISSSVREKRRILEEARLRVEALEQKQILERLLEEEEAEFKKKELEIAE